MTKQQFVQMLESHDWTYQRSDDHRKWKRGCEQRKSIMAAKVLFGDDGEHLFEKYRKKYEA
jgi:hypothetical protein